MSVEATLRKHVLVPVVVIDEVSQAQGLAQALVDGGLPVAEITLRTEAGLGAIAALADRDDLLVGAGTVLSVEQVDAAVDAGAKFIVSPGLSAQVVKRAQERGVMVLPGATSATEVQQAYELGLRNVKFFPASTNGGAKAIAALAGPFGEMNFIPTGGISAANLHEYLAVPAVIAVGGSWMVDRKAIAAGDFDAVKAATQEAVALANELRP